jgi:hypothetical protein
MTSIINNLLSNVIMIIIFYNRNAGVGRRGREGVAAGRRGEGDVGVGLEKK